MLPAEVRSVRTSPVATASFPLHARRPQRLHTHLFWSTVTMASASVRSWEGMQDVVADDPRGQGRDHHRWRGGAQNVVALYPPGCLWDHHRATGLLEEGLSRSTSMASSRFYAGLGPFMRAWGHVCGPRAIHDHHNATDNDNNINSVNPPQTRPSVVLLRPISPPGSPFLFSPCLPLPFFFLSRCSCACGRGAARAACPPPDDELARRRPFSRLRA